MCSFFCHLQNLFLYGYGAIFNFLGIVGTAIVKGMNLHMIIQTHQAHTLNVNIAILNLCSLINCCLNLVVYKSSVISMAHFFSFHLLLQTNSCRFHLVVDCSKVFWISGICTQFKQLLWCQGLCEILICLSVILEVASSNDCASGYYLWICLLSISLNSTIFAAFPVVLFFCRNVEIWTCAMQLQF